MNIVSVEKDKDTRVVSFDETGKILSVSSIEPAEDNLLFAHFKLGEISEQEGHHPDINFGWGYVKINITTHAIEGLSENDFILAAKIDQLINV